MHFIVCSVLAAAFQAALSIPLQAGWELDRSVLPSAWKIEKTIVAKSSDISRLGVAMNITMKGVTNYFINAGGIRLQINVITCESGDAAEKLKNKLQYANQSKVPVYRDGSVVFEIISDNKLVQAKAGEMIGMLDLSPVTWKAKIVVAPMEKGDPMAWNRLFNLLMNCKADPKNEAAKQTGAETAKLFTFGDRIALRTLKGPWGVPDYTFSSPVRSRKALGDTTSFEFDQLPLELDIPCLTIDATIPVKPFSLYQPETPVDCKALIRPTEFWPVDNDKVAAIVKETVQEGMAPEEVVEALLNWRRAHIRFGGDVVGARYGTLKALEQGYGRCGDHCDVLITLLRAAKIPARLVMGWLPVQGVGHFWVEAYVEGKGWLSVDATASWLGVSADYIPFVISESGAIPYVYRSIPEIEKQ